MVGWCEGEWGEADTPSVPSIRRHIAPLYRAFKKRDEEIEKQ